MRDQLASAIRTGTSCAFSRRAKRDGEARGADEQDAGPVGRPQIQRLGERAKREAVQDDGHRHQSEGVGDHAIGIGDAEAAEGRAEQAGDRHGDDAARRDPADQQPLPPGQAGAERSEEHGHRTHDEEHRREEAEHPPFQARQHLALQRRGEDDEQARDEQQRDRLLEPPQVAEAGDPRVRHGDAHDGHGQQAALLQHQIGQRVHADHGRPAGSAPSDIRAPSRGRRPSSRKRPARKPPANGDDDRQDDVEDQVARPRAPPRRTRYGLERDDREERADRDR